AGQAIGEEGADVFAAIPNRGEVHRVVEGVLEARREDGVEGVTECLDRRASARYAEDEIQRASSFPRRTFFGVRRGDEALHVRGERRAVEENEHPAMGESERRERSGFPALEIVLARLRAVDEDERRARTLSHLMGARDVR